MIPIMNATDVRKEWSTIVDSAVRVKPQFFKRTRDYCFLSDFYFMDELLKGYSFSAMINSKLKPFQTRSHYHIQQSTSRQLMNYVTMLQTIFIHHIDSYSTR